MGYDLLVEAKARSYREAGPVSVYDPEAQVVEARVLNGRVGGATCPPSPREVVFDVSPDRRFLDQGKYRDGGGGARRRGSWIR